MSTTTIIRAHNTWEDRSYEVGVTHGAERVSITLRPMDQPVGLGASLAPADARALAYELIGRARWIEQHTTTPLAVS